MSNCKPTTAKYRMPVDHSEVNTFLITKRTKITITFQNHTNRQKKQTKEKNK
jgi:hypothetical protein